MKTRPSGGWKRAFAPLWMTVLPGVMVVSSSHAEVGRSCLPGWQDLSAQQRSKFVLVEQACDLGTLPAASAQRVADATELTLSGPVPSSPLIVGDPRAADQLSMYDLAEQRRARTPVTNTTGARAVQLAPQVDATAQRHDIDPLLLHAIAYVESRHNSQAVSRAGAMGLMQVMPATGKRFGAAPSALHHPSVNLEVSATYLKTLQGRFGNDLPLVLAAYNAGEGAVERYGRHIPPYAETRDYVRQVLAQYDALRRAAEHLMRKPKSPT